MNYIITAVFFDQENIATSDPGKEGSTPPAPKLVTKPILKKSYTINTGNETKLTGAEIKAKIKADFKLADSMIDITLKTGNGKSVADDTVCEAYGLTYEATKPYVAPVK